MSARDWFYQFVTIAFNHSILSGYENGRFGPQNPVTRAEISKMLYNAMYLPKTLN